MIEARGEWFSRFSNVKLKDLVFLDEFGVTTQMVRMRGRAPRGQRLVCKTPAGHWKLLSVIAAMSVQGMLVCASVDGATDTASFVEFVRQGLIPRLRPGQVVVLDNLSPHRCGQVDELIESAGARVLRLPPYSPDLNPIEMAISKMKQLLRKLARRTVEELQQAITHAAASITRDDARGFVRHCGYAGTCR